MRKILLTGLTALLLLVGLLGLAQAIPRPAHPAGMPAAPHIVAIERFLDSAQVGEPWQWEGLTIFPITLNPVRSFGEVLTLDEAAGKGVVTISEVGSGEVNRVRVQNRSSRPVFLMAGEAITGARQDRMVSEDTLLAPHSRAEIAVWCVEHGRWTGGSEFRSGGFVAPAAVRQRAVAHKSQSDVWASVAEAQQSAGLGTPRSTSLAEVGKSERVQQRIAPFREHFAPLPKNNREVAGVIVAYGHEWLAADLFYQPSLFQRLWPKLLDSYLTDISGRAPIKGRPSVREAEEFLGRLYWASKMPADNPGEGIRVELRGNNIYGSALVMQSSVVHLEAFPGLQILEERPGAPSLQYRRERLEHGR